MNTPWHGLNGPRSLPPVRAYLASPAGETVNAPVKLLPEPDHRILVVEDDYDIRRLNTEVLMLHGYHVDAAEDGAAAWAALQQEGYDLLITDHDMPRVTGVELLKKLHGARMDLPVIMATGAFPESEFTRYPWLQPAATLLKPYTLDELLNTVREVLRAVEDVCQRPGQRSTPPLF